MTHRIIVVDDDPNTLAVLAKLLGGEGFGVQVSSGPSDALGLIERETFDILLTDLVMAEMSGLRLIEVARERQPHLRCCIMSGHERSQEVPHDVRWVTKPIDFDELLDVIEAL